MRVPDDIQRLFGKIHFQAMFARYSGGSDRLRYFPGDIG
jgi:hypothetical protein